MHPFAYRLMAGVSRATLAPNTDDPEIDLGLEEEDEELDEDDGDTEDDLSEDDDGGEDDDGPPRELTRAETRAAKLSRERNDLRETTTRLERELADLKAKPAPVATQPQETQEQFNARLAQMDPVDRVAYLANLSAQHTNTQIANLQFKIEDSTDKIGFDSFVTNNPAMRKFAAEVETRRADYLKQGTAVPRQDVLKHILGERALNNLNRAKGKAERGAATRRDAQASRPATGRGDTVREGRTTNEKVARDRRLENMKI